LATARRNTLRLISQVLPAITTSDRHHFPDDVVNNPTTSPPITHVLSPITTTLKSFTHVMLPMTTPHRIDIISQMI
jgi:hypothetical protein